MPEQIFALSIIKSSNETRFKAKNQGMNMFEVITLLRTYCKQIEEKQLKNFKTGGG